MRSMTGFGVGQAPYGDGRILVEARSVNHRFLDVRVRVPPEIGENSFVIEQQLRKRCHRGRYDLSLRLELSTAESPFDTQRARAAYAALQALRDELAPGKDVPIAAVLSLPAVVTAATPLMIGPAMREAASLAVDRALDNLDAMRCQEGAALASELAERLAAARALTQSMIDRMPLVTQMLAERLRERIQRAMVQLDVTADPARLETEIALLADRADITEELARLRSHYDQFETLIASKERVGRQLDFLLQEMSRETNTIGAKSPDAQLSHWVVELKAEVERMREQVQNVE